MPNEILVVFHNGLNYDYPFVIKELPNAFKGKLKCIGENAEEYKSFPFQKKN